MKTLVIFLFSLLSPLAYTYPGNIVDKAIEAAEDECKVSYDVQDVDDVEQVDSGHDYATYMVFFRLGDNVSITQTFDGSREVSFWVDDVYCRE